MGTGRPLIMLSGGFDPLHAGHIRMMLEADKFGDVIIALNSDKWLKRKKHYKFMEWEQRATILRAVRYVSAVVEFDDSDNTCTDALRQYNPTYFGNGGDRTEENIPEISLCDELGIQCLFNLGGVGDEHSSELFNRAVEEMYDGRKT